MTTTNAIIKTIEMPKRTLAYVSNVGPYMGNAALFERLFSQVLSWMQLHNLASEMTEAITVYHDDPKTTPPEKHRISVGFTVPIGTEGKDKIQIMELPAGKYLIGSFEIGAHEYADAWEEMMRYMQEHRHIPAAGPMYESYKNDPEEHPEGKHLVDLGVALHS